MGQNSVIKKRQCLLFRLLHPYQSWSHLQGSWWQQCKADLHNIPLFKEGRGELTLSMPTLGKNYFCTVTTPGPPMDIHTSWGTIADLMDGVRASFPLRKPFLHNPHTPRRNSALGVHQLPEKATTGADAAGSTLEIAQTNRSLAPRKTASCSLQHNTLWY